VLTTGSGFCGPTGLATPCALEAAGACTGTRLPLPSTTVDNDCTLVLASLTSSVMEPPINSQWDEAVQFVGRVERSATRRGWTRREDGGLPPAVAGVHPPYGLVATSGA